MTRLARQDGFTLVETLVAFLLLVMGVLATFQLLDASRRTTVRAEESQAINDIAQRELEEIRSLEYDEVGLTGAPPSSSESNHPGSRVGGSAPNGTFDLRDGGGVADLVQNGGSLEGGGTVAGGLIAPSESFTEGDVSGTIYRYVVWRDDPECLLCTGDQDYKRVIVAVKVDQAATATFERSYQEFQSDFVDPDEGPLTAGDGSTGDLTTAQQFWLSDQSCQATGEPEPAFTADSSTNDTTSTCTSTASKPDALISQAPPAPSLPDDPIPDPADYATDLEAGGLADSGLQMISQGTDTCDSAPSGTDAKNRIHWWASKRLVFGSDGSFVMTGDSTLELWTGTVDNSVAAPGAICVYLRERPVNTLFLELTRVPIPLVSISSPTAGFSCAVESAEEGIGKCSSNDWRPPNGNWQKLRIRLTSSPSLSLGGNSRIELGLSTTDTTSDTLEFMYDHPTYDSRFEVITTTPL